MKSTHLMFDSVSAVYKCTLLEKRVFQRLLKYRKLFFYNLENSLFKKSFLSTNTAKYSTKEYSIS